ncbi:hypothetical protein WEN_02520 [Mycoplasma wenyonii str. Massachusetts]|uniref:Uncharacterized protein n=1 Tax=Mycoplasma wenyonii (strain Massachusetts) TaxID=1197325 RepID=I6YLY2_MYCWM|nr:hypothetical protein WEN_02520 [Mycoplasma wenyonii str. Massachusetts]
MCGGGGTNCTEGLRVNVSLWKANDSGTVEAIPNPEKPLARIVKSDKMKILNCYWNFKFQFFYI